MALVPDAPLQRYLLDGERVVVAVRRHWVQILEPSLSAAAGLGLTLWIEATLRPGAIVVARLAWWAWFFLVARLVWYAVQWRLDWFVATDKRLVLTQGVFRRKVAMMPLAKVTDMSFVQSIPGRLLGYGKFVMESAGQEQSLREVDWIPHAPRTYRIICAEIFGVDDHARVLADDDAQPDEAWDDWADGPRGPGAPGDPSAAGGQTPSAAVHHPVLEHRYRLEREPVEPERAPDTGPVRYYPSD